MAPLARVTRYIGLRRATALQALSPDIAEELAGLGVPRTKIMSIPNGVDVSLYKPSGPTTRLQFRRALDLPADGVIVLFTGRFARHKGIDDLLTVWSSLNLPDAWLLLVGTNETTDPEAPIEAVPGVIVRSWTEDVLSYYRAVDAFALPSYVEGMSNAILEAMACGLPVIATRIGAASEMISDGSSGFLVAVGASAELARALGRVVSDEALRGQLGGEARRTVVAAYAIDAVSARIEAEYRRIWARR
jgi:glycosyltransferase involved in cell wall biosynthesis